MNLSWYGTNKNILPDLTKFRLQSNFCTYLHIGSISVFRQDQNPNATEIQGKLNLIPGRTQFSIWSSRCTSQNFTKGNKWALGSSQTFHNLSSGKCANKVMVKLCSFHMALRYSSASGQLPQWFHSSPFLFSTFIKEILLMLVFHSKGSKCFSLCRRLCVHICSGSQNK